MAPLSFEPAAEAGYRSGVFSQYPATLLGEQNISHQTMFSFGSVTILHRFYQSYILHFQRRSLQSIKPRKTSSLVILTWRGNLSLNSMMCVLFCIGFWWEADTWAVLSNALSVTSPPDSIHALWWPRRTERNRHGQIRSRHYISAWLW